MKVAIVDADKLADVHRLNDHILLLLKIAVVSVVIMAVVAAIVLREQSWIMTNSLIGTRVGFAGFVLGKLFLSVTIMLFGWRLILFLRYRPMAAALDENLPTCTIIIPAFNEGKQVLLTLRSVAASNYPEDKLQIIAVDDGSADDTWFWISVAAAELGSRLTTIRLPENRGKRHALYAGFELSQSEVLITIDSDSMVDSDTVRNLVSPFVFDKRIGAMAGNVRVLNLDEGLIPKMLDVIFHFSFNFIRASQSMVKTVICTPGALSAYRTETVRPVLQEWLEQKFCGRPANIGEDRALTNLILRDGHHVLFQNNAVVYTNVPVRYNNLCKMFIRWARSNVRESLVMAGFIFRRFRHDSMLGARINLIDQLVSMVRNPFVMLFTLVVLCRYPLVSSSAVLLGVVVSSSISVLLYAQSYRSTEALWGFLYGFFWLVALSWIAPFAMITPHKSGWLTRTINVDARQSLFVGKRSEQLKGDSIYDISQFFPMEPTDKN